MTNEWMGLTDDRLADVAQQGPHALVEAMRRLRVAIEQSCAKNDIYLRRMLWLNIILTAITFALAIAAVPTLVQAFTIIKAWFS